MSAEKYADAQQDLLARASDALIMKTVRLTQSVIVVLERTISNSCNFRRL